ncbi:hypothetical protein Tco_0779945 [Tanacetum coccineum]
MKNNSVCKENGSNVFRKEREQYHEIQDLKAQMQDKNIAISELKKLIENCKGKSVETQFNKPSVVRQKPMLNRIKTISFRKPDSFFNSPEIENKDAKSHKTTKRYMPIEKSSASKKPERQVPTGHSLISHKRKGKSFNGQKQQRIELNADALYNAKQENLRVWPRSSMFKRRLITADQALVFMAMTSDHNRSELGIHDHSNEPSTMAEDYSPQCFILGFKSHPKSSHLSAIKKIFRYLKGKPKLGLWYPKVSSFDLESYSDSDYAGANLDRKSTQRQNNVAASKTLAMSQVLDSNQMLDYMHNMVAYLGKSEGNAEFHEIINFLTRSSIHHALTISLVVSTIFVEQFWTSAKSKIINNVRHITAKRWGLLQKDHLKHYLHPPLLPLVKYLIEPPTDSSPAHTSEVPTEKQTNLSPRPSPSTIIPDSIPKTSGGNLEFIHPMIKSLSGLEGEITV